MASSARTRVSSFVALGMLLAVAACTADATSVPSSPFGEDPSQTTPPPSSTADPKDPPSKDKDTDKDPPPKVDKTVKFELTIDGESIKPDAVTVEVDKGTGGDPDRILIKAQHEQDFGTPFTSTATFTLRLVTTAKGQDICGTAAGRSADYWFKDGQGGAIRGIGTMYVGGNCTMNIVANEADDFTSGTAQGTLGGAVTKSFSVKWGQNLP